MHGLPTATQETLIVKMRALDRIEERDAAALQSCVLDEGYLEAGMDFVRFGDAYPAAIVILSGWAMRYRELSDGGRQILNFLIRGDAAGFAATILARADHSIGAITAVRYARLDSARLLDLVGSNPRLGVLLFWSVALEEAVLREHLVGVGKRPALQQLAHLLVELTVRQRRAGIEAQTAQCLPLTQAALADAIGVSEIHANRLLRTLRQDGLVATNRRAVVIEDEAGLRRIARWDDTYLHRDAGFSSQSVSAKAGHHESRP